MTLLDIQSHLSPCYFTLLSPKYSPQHFTLKHQKSVFFTWCEGPSFTPMQNNR